MKALITLIAILFFGSFSIAQTGQGTIGNIDAAIQNGKKELSVDVKKVETVQPGTDATVRLYRFRNSLILKELSFTTKQNKAKLA